MIDVCLLKTVVKFQIDYSNQLNKNFKKAIKKFRIPCSHSLRHTRKIIPIPFKFEYLSKKI